MASSAGHHSIVAAEPAPTPASPRRRPIAREPWDAGLAGLRGIGPRRVELYAAAGLKTRRELLYHLPVRYRLRPAAQPLAALLERPASEGGDGRAAVTGAVQRTSVRRRGRRSTVSVRLLCDGGGELSVLLFNRAYLAKSLRGARLWVAGRLEPQQAGPPRLLASDYEPLPESEDAAPAGLQLPPLPIYRLPAGIAPRVHRKLIAAILDAGAVPDWRDDPRAKGSAAGLPALDSALRAIHRPTSVDAARAARRRLAHDEAFALSLDVAARRRRGAGGRAAALPIDDALHARLLARLPHVPTAAQRRALDEIRADLRGGAGRPMARLLQGDVGSGKTLLAVYAMLAAVECGRQAALMAPTEILAAQHVRGLRALLAAVCGERAPRVAFVGAGAASSERAAVASGEAALAVGTHALQGAGLRFARLALTVVDEQHRFGVRQRSRFREKGDDTHLLVMTATPIPRTLALTAYGELDVSVLDELPPGRAPRTTELVGPERQKALWVQLREAVGRGERGFVVCPSIGGAGGAGTGAGSRDDGDDDVEAGHSVAVTLRRVQRALGAGVQVGAVHGRMPSDERDAVLAAFREGALDVLVATVLVEVGLDVPEATFVVLPDASRFGLAQMHQIRGRVGRGGRPGRCLVLLPLPEGAARARAEALAATDDGFRLAERDLALRGPGELLGTAQSGMPDFIALDPVRDVELLALTRPAAFAAAAGLSDKALAALRARVFPELELRTENLLAGG